MTLFSETILLSPSKRFIVGPNFSRAVRYFQESERLSGFSCNPSGTIPVFSLLKNYSDLKVPVVDLKFGPRGEW